MMRVLSLVFATALLTAPVALAAAPAPRVRTASFDDLAKPLPLPYDEAADASATDAKVAAARARAKASRKLLLIDLGGNWCLDCRILAGTIELPELKKFVDRHYEIVTVDVGRFNKNLQVPASYGFVDRLKGVPAVLIVDPKTNTLLNQADTTALSDARHMSPQGLADYLAKWAR